MESPVQITFKGMDSSEAVRRRVEREVAKLEKLFGRLTECRVVVEAPARPARHGGLFGVHVHLSVPGGRHVAVSREPAADQAHEDAYVAIRDAFRAARRQLRVHVRKMAPGPESQVRSPIGTVVRLFAEDGYGFLESPDGREIYFHRNSVLNGAFDRLAVGSAVRFNEEEGAQGPQASTVEPAGKHKLR